MAAVAFSCTIWTDCPTTSLLASNAPNTVPIPASTALSATSFAAAIVSCAFSCNILCFPFWSVSATCCTSSVALATDLLADCIFFSDIVSKVF